MKLTVKQLRNIIKEEVQNVVKEATRDPRNLEMDLEDMSTGDSLDIQIHSRSGVVDATITKSPAPRGTWGMGPDGEEVELDSTYVLNLGRKKMDFTYPTEITDYLNDNGMEFSY